MDYYDANDKCKELIAEWLTEDKMIDLNKVTFKGFADLDFGVAGKCLGYKDGKSEIFISHKLIGHDAFMEAVLWHEYCHSYTWYNYHTMNHDSDYHKKKFSKPILAILDVISAFAFNFMGGKNEDI